MSHLRHCRKEELSQMDRFKFQIITDKRYRKTPAKCFENSA